MKNKHLWLTWGFLYIVCAAGGFIRGTWGPGWLWTGLALLFFLPPFLLLYRGKRSGDGKTVQLLRYLSTGSLVLTVAAVLLNFLSVLASPALGTALHALLTIVSVPMLALDIWAVSLFLWSFLLAGTFAGKKK